MAEQSPDRVSYAPTEELDLIRSTTRQFLEDRAPMGKVREIMMSEDGFDRGLWEEMAGMGWTGLAIPEEHGGAGYGFLELSVILEEMGRAVTPGPFFSSAVLATTAILELGSDDQKADLLPGLASGETVAGLAVFESPRDWGLKSLTTKASRVGGGWVLDGAKSYVLDGHKADLLLVVSRLEEGLGVFVVDRRAEGVRVEQTPTLDATRRQATVALDGVALDEDALLGGGPSREALRRVMALASAALACEQTGGAQKVLEMSVSYAKTRHQFGRPIGSFQAVKHRCAEMLIDVEHARSVAYHAARVADSPEELAIASPLAASICSEAYVRAAGENIQIHGGIGFTWEHDAHLYLKRAKASSLLLGDPGYQRSLLGEALGL